MIHGSSRQIYRRQYWCPCGNGWSERFRLDLREGGVLYTDERTGHEETYASEDDVPRARSNGSTCPACARAVPPEHCPACGQTVELVERDRLGSALDDWEYDQARLHVRCPAGHESCVVEWFEGWAY
jgi:hypothetical protein